VIIAPADASTLATQTLLMRQGEQDRLRRISRYLRNRSDPPYAPRGVNAEYRWIQRKSKRNFLRLIVSVISQNLHVDGYRPTGYTTNQVAAPQRPNPTWDAFRSNRMISRQHGVHRSVIKYGSAYTVVLPGQLSTDEEQAQDVPVIRPVSPRRMTALYADDVDDEWPQFAIEVRQVQLPGNRTRVYVSVYDEQNRFILASQVISGYGSIANYNLTLADPGDPLLDGQDPISTHGLGVCPVVRFLYEADLDGEDDCSGEVEPIIEIQDQINFTTFNEMMTEQYSAFRQRWVTGMAPVDEQGKEQAPFRPGVDRVWAAEDPGTHFGEFSETALAPYSGTREDAIRHMSTVTQVPPYHLLGQIANMSAEALAAARDGLDRKIEELQGIMTDSWRNTFRLCSLASGDKDGWNDLFGTIVWRDTSARSFAATIDGLTKIAQMLGVPEQELWARIPGVTADDVASWQLAAQREQAQALIQQAVQQATGAGAPAVGAAPSVPVPGVTAGVPIPAEAVPGGLPGQIPQPLPQGGGGGTPPSLPRGPGGKPAQ
jgi:Phage portal protein, SPP1 Gp6-like